MKTARQAFLERQSKRPKPAPTAPEPDLYSTAGRLLLARDEFTARRGPIIGGMVAAMWSLIPNQSEKMLPWHHELKADLSRLWIDLPRRKVQDSTHLDVQRYVRSPKDRGVQRINSELSQWEKRRHDRLSSDIDPDWLPSVVAPKDDQTGVLTAHIRLYEPASERDLLIWYTVMNGRLPHIQESVYRLWDKHKSKLDNKSARQQPLPRRLSPWKPAEPIDPDSPQGRAPSPITRRKRAQIICYGPQCYALTDEQAVPHRLCSSLEDAVSAARERYTITKMVGIPFRYY